MLLWFMPCHCELLILNNNFSALFIIIMFLGRSSCAWNYWRHLYRCPACSRHDSCTKYSMVHRQQFSLVCLYLFGPCSRKARANALSSVFDYRGLFVYFLHKFWILVINILRYDQINKLYSQSHISGDLLTWCCWVP